MGMFLLLSMVIAVIGAYEMGPMACVTYNLTDGSMCHIVDMNVTSGLQANVVFTGIKNADVLSGKYNNISNLRVISDMEYESRFMQICNYYIVTTIYINSTVLSSPHCASQFTEVVFVGINYLVDLWIGYLFIVIVSLSIFVYLCQLCVRKWKQYQQHKDTLDQFHDSSRKNMEMCNV